MLNSRPKKLPTVPVLSPVAQQNGAATIFIADRGHRPLEVTESDPEMLEVLLLLLEPLKRERNIEAQTLIRDRDEGALAGEHDLHGNGFGRIGGVAMLVGIA